MKKYLITAIFSMAVIWVEACDICGCSLRYGGFGYVPLQRSSLLSVGYMLQNFNTLHPGLGSLPDELSHEQFQTIELWARHFISDRWMLSANVPFKQNSIELDREHYRIRGIGDVRLGSHYALWNRGNADTILQALWTVGGGLKLPSGAYDIATGGSLLPNLQAGTGSVDMMLASNLSIRKFNMGLNLEANYYFNGHNQLNYKFGNQSAIKILGFYRKKVKSLVLIPQAGLAYNHAGSDLSNYHKRETALYSGVQLLNMTTGLDLYSGVFGLRLNCDFPLYSRMSASYVTPSPAFRTQFLYFINT